MKIAWIWTIRSKLFKTTLDCFLLDAPLAVLDADDAHVDPFLGVGGDGELRELALLNPNVPVSVDLATAKPFLPTKYRIKNNFANLENAETAIAESLTLSGKCITDK